MDPFVELPIEILQTILSLLWFTYGTKESAKTSILSKRFLQAWSTHPELCLVEGNFNKLLDQTGEGFDEFGAEAAKQNHQIHEARERFVKYIDHTLIRYQEQNIPIMQFYLNTCVVNEKYANILEHCIRKAKENRVKEFYLWIHMESFPASSSSSSTTLLQTIFGLNELVYLKLRGIDLVKDVICNNGIIKCSSLRELGSWNVIIDEGVLRKLIHSCSLIVDLVIITCPGIETTQVTELPLLKYLHVNTIDNQQVEVKAATLEKLIYAKSKSSSSPYQVNIELTQNLKRLILSNTDIMDEHLHCLIAKFPLLEELILFNCDGIRKITMSSDSLISFLSVESCGRLVEVKIDVVNLNRFEYSGSTLPSLSFASGGNSGKRKSRVTLHLTHLEEASSFLELSKFLMNFRRSDYISLNMYMPRKISFDMKIIHDLRECIPEFDELLIIVTSPSSMCSTLMEGLLWSFFLAKGLAKIPSD